MRYAHALRFAVGLHGTQKFHPIVKYKHYQILSGARASLVSTQNHVCTMGCSISKGFNVTGLIYRYTGLSNILNNSTTGGSLGGQPINHVLYADDLCIVSSSLAGLQNLLSICEKYCTSHSVTFNVKKSACMFFKSNVNKHCNYANVCLSSNHFEFVQEVKYVGVLLTLYDPGGGGLLKLPLRNFAFAHLLLELHYCALGTFPQKWFGSLCRKKKFDWGIKFGLTI